MDGIGNVKDHASYLQYFFHLENIRITSLIDFGFGLGYLFREFLKKFRPKIAEGIEPSSYAFKQARKLTFASSSLSDLKLYNENLEKWCLKNAKNNKVFDLGICTSVFQYLSDREIKQALPIMAEKVKYLYFSVPTEKELSRQSEEIDFSDDYALERSSKEYANLIKEHFTVVSSRVLESKIHFNESNTQCTELFFRF